MAKYRNTQNDVGCSRIMIDNPRGSVSKIQYERYRVAGTAPDTVDIPVTAAQLRYQSDSTKDGYNGSTVFALPEGIIEGVTELTYHQYYQISSALFDKISEIQDTADVAREAYYAAAADQGNTSQIL
jgi:hypothetical protein